MKIVHQPDDLRKTERFGWVSSAAWLGSTAKPGTELAPSYSVPGYVEDLASIVG